MIPGDAACIYSIQVPTLQEHLLCGEECFSLGCHDGSRLDDCVTHLV